MADESTSNANRDVTGAEGTRRREYVVIARRYRPASFDELIGQEHVARALSSAISTGRVGHAYLFTGPRGVGKTSAARILAKALNCENGPTATPCNQCAICQSIAGGDDVDVLEIDGASHRGIDEIRQLRQNVNIRPSRARFKIYIIDEVHMLTKEAFNALLKTLEEPPEHVKFIFATTEPEKIPITIHSRCQRFDFAGIDAAAIQRRLEQIVEKEGIAAPPESLALIARRAGGSMRDSQSLLEQLLAAGDRKITLEEVNAVLGTAPAVRVSEVVDCLLRRDAAGALAAFDAAAEQGAEPAQFIEQLLGYWRDMMVAAVGCDAAMLRHTLPAQAQEVAARAADLGVETILAAVQILEQVAVRMRSSVHERTLAEAALVRLAGLENLDELPALIEALQGDAPLARRSAPTAGDAALRKGEAASKKNGNAASEPVGSSADRRGPARGASPLQQPPIKYMGKLSPDRVVPIWEHVLGVLKERNELVAEQAGLGHAVTMTGPDTLAVCFRETYTSSKQFCELADQKLKLEQALVAATGEPVRLTFSIDKEPEGTARQADAPRRLSRRQLQADVLRRPMVRRAMELFDAEPSHIEPPEGG